MFCPKCGSDTPENGRFCRKCGTDLTAVSRAIGSDTHTGMDLMAPEVDAGTDIGADDGLYLSGRRRRRGKSCSPEDKFAAGVRASITGIGFLVISVVLFFTNVAGGHGWWWAMMFPGFAMLASGLGHIASARRAERMQQNMPKPLPTAKEGPYQRPALDPAGSDFVAPPARSSFETGDLVPPSVVEGTTKHLKMDSEGETMTLPNLHEEGRS